MNTKRDMQGHATDKTTPQTGRRDAPAPIRQPRDASAPQGGWLDGDSLSLLTLQRLAGNEAVDTLLPSPCAGAQDGAEATAMPERFRPSARPLAPPWAGRSLPVQRQATSPVVVQRMSDKDTADLDQAGLLIAKAVGEVGVATTALNTYAATVPNLLGQLRGNFNDGLQLYKQAQEKVNYIIEEAKEIAEVQNTVLKQIIDAATAGLTSRITVFEHEFPGIESLSLGEFKAGLLEDELMKPVSAKLDEAIEAATAPPTPPAAPALGGADELAFEKCVNSLQAKALKFLPVANLAAQVSQPIGSVDEAVKNARELGQTRHDLPVSKILKDAQTLVGLGARLASAAPGITNATRELQDVLTVARTIAPTSEDDAEKQLWIAWAGSLDVSNYKAVDLDVIENYLKRKGIWDQLGIDPGIWFSDKEQVMAVCSAFAQTKISASRGTTVTLTLYNGNPDRVSLPDITPTLPVRMTSDSKGVDYSRDTTVEAVVMGATAIKKADTDVLSQTSPTKEVVAEWLLSHNYVAVILKGIQEVGAAPPT
jgi:hypothetical protein